MGSLLFKTGCQRGIQARISTRALGHSQAAGGVTERLRDRLSGREFAAR
ncbi:hypothetical protein [Jannaschia seohaensis]|nr:hypothetical protein [Jannaschia seohaensis]